MTKIVRHYPRLGMLGHLQQDINRLFEPFGWQTDNDAAGVMVSDWSPHIDIKDEGKEYVIFADIPGVDPKDIEIQMENGILTIKGQKEVNKEEKNENFVRVERSRGTFMRRFSLPDIVDASAIKAKSKHGVLQITVPKVEKAKSRKIEVEHSE